MMSKSLQLNGITWKCSVLGEKAILLEPKVEKNHLELIHQSTTLLEQAKPEGVTDIIPAYQSIALIFNRLISGLESEIEQIQSEVSINKIQASPKSIHKVPVCYEMGLDWEEVESLTSQKKEEIILKYLNGDYTVAMLGFIPGFVFLQGLDESLTCPRKANPRTNIPAGSVGIGGNQAGIYSLESPGGWQIIGRTPILFFNLENNPPTPLKPGDKMVFERISEAEFVEMEGEKS